MTPEPHIVQAIGMPAGMEWLVILIVALLLFGSRLPSMMRGLGGSIKEFKKGMEEGHEKTEKKEESPAAPTGAISRDAQLDKGLKSDQTPAAK
jgi:sec-independent protein translocase protein TatA